MKLRNQNAVVRKQLNEAQDHNIDLLRKNHESLAKFVNEFVDHHNKEVIPRLHNH